MALENAQDDLKRLLPGGDDDPIHTAQQALEQAEREANQTGDSGSEGKTNAEYALLKAAENRELRVMFPMVASIEEFDRAKAMVEHELTHLRRHGHRLPDRVQVGVMVEVVANVPAAGARRTDGRASQRQMPLASWARVVAGSCATA